MSFRLALAPFAVCSAFLALAQTAPAQIKVGVVNLQEAVFQSAEIKKADADMTAKFKPRQDALEKATAEGNALVAKAQASPQASTDLQAQIQRKQREVQRLQDDLQADADRERNDILTASSQKMEAIVKKLAEERGLDLIVDSATTLYFKPVLDLTKDALAAYDKAYPVSAAGAAK